MQLTLFREPVREAWIDYNGHLNDGYYALLFSWATDELLVRIGLGPDVRKTTRHTIYTLETHVRFLSEVKLGAPVRIDCALIEHDAKRMRLLLTMIDESRTIEAATSEQLLISVDQSGEQPRTAPWLPAVAEAIAALAPLPDLIWPEFVGRGIALRRR